MATVFRLSALCVILSTLTILSGCSKKGDNWLVGKWAFDLEATKANIPANNKAQGVPDSVAKKMGDRLTSQLLSQMIGSKYDITASKMTVTLGNGTKKYYAYRG